MARLAGIRVRRLITSVYIGSGILSAVAAIALAARLDSSQPSAGLGSELDAIAAVVSFQKRFCRYIRAIMPEKIEGTVNSGSGGLLLKPLKQLKMRNAVFIERDNLAIENR